MALSLRSTILTLLSISMLFSCNLERTTNPTINKSSAFGKINRVYILVEDNLIEGPIKDTISDYFEAPYPILTAYEPIFDISYLDVGDLLKDPLKKELRTFVVIADLLNEDSDVTKMLQLDLGPETFQKALDDPSFNSTVGRDKWASNQLIIYLFGKGNDGIARALRENWNKISSRILEHDKPSMKASIYGAKTDNRELIQTIKDSFGVSIKVPGMFQKALQDENFLWIRMDNKIVNQSLVIRKFKYTQESQFSKENIINWRNEYGKQYITTGQEDAYMTTNIKDLPIYEYTYTHNKMYTREIRGIWETENDWMGGPFISYVFHKKNTNELIFIDAFVYAPDREKRDLVQQLDYIVKTIQNISI